MPTVGEGQAAARRRTERAAVTAVLVVDDQRAFADAVGLAVDSQRGLRCVGAVGSAEAALERIRESCPDVVLLDIRLPGMRGVDAISLLKAQCPLMRILMLTAHTSRRTVLEAVAAGADGFLPKEAPFTEILDAVRAPDNILVADEILAQVVHLGRETGRHEGDSADEAGLTEREGEILSLLAQGRPVKQIARHLGISVYTCRGHVRAILHKLGVHSQLAAVVAAARRGLLNELGD
jgi:DNA-binding NarL/FixJ family response regulator